MVKIHLILGAALALFATASLAATKHDHGSHNEKAALETTPADGAMGAPPQTFSAKFEHPMRFTALVITPSRGDPIAVTIPEGKAETTASIVLPSLSPGNYTFTWTATGAENHTMTGRVRYRVQ